MPRQHIQQHADVQPQSDARPLLVGEALPAVCLVADVARVLRVSERRVYQLRSEGRLRDFLLHSIDGTLRFNGQKLSAYRDGTFEPRFLRLKKSA